VLKAVIKAAEAAARTASLNTAHKATTSTRTEAGDADGSADARGATILLGADRVFLFKARQEEGHEENRDLPATLDEHFVSTHTAVTSVLAAFSGMIAPPKGEKPRLR
jgi:hypothetical protein